MEQDREKKKEKPYGFYVIIPILVFVTILTVISFINPEILIGWYLDNDIRNQLLEVHQPDATNLEMNVRFTFTNDDIVDMRVSRAIDVFNELFENYERDYSIIELEDDTLLELTWMIN